MQLPYWWSHVIFFPGVVFHELTHYLACVLVGMKVSKVRWWGLKEAKVVHEAPKDPGASMMISMAPFMGATILGTVFLFLGHLLLFEKSLHVHGIFSYWFALSLLYHCFPSREDQKNMWKSLKKYYKGKIGAGSAGERMLWLFVTLLSAPLLLLLLGLTWLFNYHANLSVVWFVLLYFATYLYLFPKWV
jgi:hypothetical protein